MIRPSVRRISDALLECLAYLEFFEDQVQSFTWDEDASAFLKFCLERNIITEDILKQSVRMSLKLYGERCYQQHIRSLGLLSSQVIYPDHVTSPQALAFAIQVGSFTEKQLKKIRFDHGYTTETFYPNIVEDLTQTIAEQLLKWKNPVFTERRIMEACC